MKLPKPITTSITVHCYKTTLSPYSEIIIEVNKENTNLGLYTTIYIRGKSREDGLYYVLGNPKNVREARKDIKQYFSPSNY
jgi:molybdate-binding protein